MMRSGVRELIVATWRMHARHACCAADRRHTADPDCEAASATWCMVAMHAMRSLTCACGRWQVSGRGHVSAAVILGDLESI